MEMQLIDIDTVQPNGKRGDPARVMAEKINANTQELYDVTAKIGVLAGVNMLISCGIPVNQAGFGGGAVAAGAYGYDMWKAGAGGCNVTINAATGVFTHASGALQQVVETPLLAWGRPLTISVEDPTGNVTVSVGGATGTITAGTGRRGVTVTPSGSGNMVVQLTATGASYSRPKLERGSVATPFVPVALALDLAMVQRYFERGWLYLYGCVSASGGHIGTQSTFKVVKRATPAMVYLPPTVRLNLASNAPSVDRTFVGIIGVPENINQNFVYVGEYTADARL